MKLRVVRLSTLSSAAKRMRLGNRGDRLRPQFAPDLQALTDQELLGWVDVHEEFDSPGDFGRNATTVLQNERVFVHARNARASAEQTRQIQRIGGRDERPV